MTTATTCRGCGTQVAPTAGFCFVCRAPDPVLPHAARYRAGRRQLWITGSIAAVAWLAACVGLWLTFAH